MRAPEERYAIMTTRAPWECAIVLLVAESRWSVPHQGRAGRAGQMPSRRQRTAGHDGQGLGGGGGGGGGGGRWGEAEWKAASGEARRARIGRKGRGKAMLSSGRKSFVRVSPALVVL